MLRNRKFAGDDQPPQGRASAEQYGIPYPWRAVNRLPAPAMRYTHDNTVFYNGLQSQRIDLNQPDGEPHGITQDKVAVQAGRSYEVRLALSQNGMPGPVYVTLGKGGMVYASYMISHVAVEWQTYSFALKSEATDPDAEFAIAFRQPGKLWVGAASLMPADNVLGWRKDVLEMIRDIRAPVLRYPGGNFVSGYHWQDSIGDRDSRPIRYDYAWNVWETNDVGIDEFMQLCDLLQCEPYISVNAGNGTAAEAAAWVEYCNGAPNTVYGAKRAANGHPQPYGVKYWGIGNEMYGNWQIGHCDPETFARRHVAFAQAMRAIDPTITLLGVGDMPDQPGQWLDIVTEIAGEYIDLMTVHHYTGVPDVSSDVTAEARRRADPIPANYDEAMRNAMATACPEHIAALLRETRRVLDEKRPQGHRIGISFDEWNIVNRGAGPRQDYALRDGLYAAGMLNVFQRECRSVTMANIAQLVNLLGVIETTPTDVYGSAIYWAFKLYRDYTGDVALEVAVEGETFDVPAIANIPEMKGAPYLGVSASLDTAKNALCLAVINRHATEAISAEIQAEGAVIGAQARIWELNGPDMAARNSAANKENVGIRDRGAAAAGPRFTYTFPAHSVTVLQIPLV